MTLPPLVPRALARLSKEEREGATLYHPTAIEALLTDILEKSVPLTIFYNARHFFISKLFQCTPTECIIDAPPPLNTPSLEPENILQIMGTIEQVPFHFVAKNHRLIEWEKFPALSFATPSAIVRLQRRNTFRLMIPRNLEIPATCMLEGKRRHVRVVDISMGGIRLANILPEWLEHISQGQLIAMTLQLDGLDIRLDMQVTNAQVFRLRDGSSHAQLCLRFQELPAKIEVHLARFLMKNEVLLAKKD